MELLMTEGRLAGGSITIAPGLPGIGMIGISVSYVDSTFLVSFIGGIGPSVDGFGKPLSIEAVFLPANGSVSNLTGWGAFANTTTLLPSATISFQANGQVASVQGGIGFSIGLSGGVSYTLT